MALAAAISFAGSRRLEGGLIVRETDSVWFEADTGDFVPMMTDRATRHSDTRVHPLFPLLTYPLVKAARVAFGVEPMRAVQIVLAAASAAWLGVLFALLRLIGCRRLDAMLFALVAAASASAVFWFAIPESWVFGSLTILLALCLVAADQSAVSTSLPYVVVSALTLSVTVTNWMAGVVATFARFPWRRAFQLTVNAFCLVVVLWGAQRAVFPGAKFFLENPKKGAFLFHRDAGGARTIARAFVAHSMVAPDIGTRWKQRLTVQRFATGSGSRLGPAAVWLWAALLGLGAWGAWRHPGHRRLRLVLAALLLGQFALHLIYGEETFLYALHFMPLLVILAAFGSFTPARRAVLALAAALVVCAGINNAAVFDRASGRFLQRAAELQAQARGKADAAAAVSASVAE